MSKVGTTDITGIMLGDTEIVKAYLGSDIVYQKSKPSYEDQYLTFVAKGSGTFTFTPQNSNVISYSKDGGTTWTTGNSVEVNSGDEVMWKGTMTPQSSQGIGIFSATGNFDVQGNIMSLLHGDDFKEQTDLTRKDYAFYNLFNYNTKIVNAKNLSLPATTLAQRCYYSMFYGCTNLTTTPELPATTLVFSCYSNMFRGCTNLTSAPELPATTLSAYCYNYMFNGCTKLNYIKAMFTTTPSTTYTSNWVSGVASTGTFVKNSAATWNVTGVNGVPSRWTVQTADE
jgi:hypothetical protein